MGSPETGQLYFLIPFTSCTLVYAFNTCPFPIVFSLDNGGKTAFYLKKKKLFLAGLP
jgi:hypothetical protein